MLWLVRHGDASGSRSGERHLSARGQEQAARLAAAFKGRTLGRVLASPYLRCHQTVAPLAAAVSLEVEEHNALGEAADIEPTWQLLESLAESPAVLCTHAPVIDGVLHRIHRRGGEVVASDLTSRTASVWRIEPGVDGSLDRAVLELRQA